MITQEQYKLLNRFFEAFAAPNASLDEIKSLRGELCEAGVNAYEILSMAVGNTSSREQLSLVVKTGGKSYKAMQSRIQYLISLFAIGKNEVSYGVSEDDITRMKEGLLAIPHMKTSICLCLSTDELKQLKPLVIDVEKELFESQHSFYSIYDTYGLDGLEQFIDRLLATDLPKQKQYLESLLNNEGIYQKYCYRSILTRRAFSASDDFWAKFCKLLSHCDPKTQAAALEKHVGQEGDPSAPEPILNLIHQLPTQEKKSVIMQFSGQYLRHSTATLKKALQMATAEDLNKQDQADCLSHILGKRITICSSANTELEALEITTPFIKQLNEPCLVTQVIKNSRFLKADPGFVDMPANADDLLIELVSQASEQDQGQFYANIINNLYAETNSHNKAAIAKRLHRYIDEVAKLPEAIRAIALNSYTKKHSSAYYELMQLKMSGKIDKQELILLQRFVKLGARLSDQQQAQAAKKLAYFSTLEIALAIAASLSGAIFGAAFGAGIIFLTIAALLTLVSMTAALHLAIIGVSATSISLVAGALAFGFYALTQTAPAAYYKSALRSTEQSLMEATKPTGSELESQRSCLQSLSKDSKKDTPAMAFPVDPNSSHGPMIMGTPENVQELYETMSGKTTYSSAPF